MLKLQLIYWLWLNNNCSKYWIPLWSNTLHYHVCFLKCRNCFKNIHANFFCASLLHTKMHAPAVCVLSNKMKNDRAYGHCYSSAWIWWPWRLDDPCFFSQKQIQSPHCPKMNKNSVWEDKKISRFLSTEKVRAKCFVHYKWENGFLYTFYRTWTKQVVQWQSIEFTSFTRFDLCGSFVNSAAARRKKTIGTMTIL